MMRTRNQEAALRAQERREREDHSPRLREEVPALEVLSLELSERRAEADRPDVKHVRRVVVAAAPAYFQSPCGDTLCTDGGYEYTRYVMQSLRNHEQLFTSEHTCRGNVGNRTCGRVLTVTGHATYRTS